MSDRVYTLFSVPDNSQYGKLVMTEVHTEATFEGSLHQVFEGVKSYADYPEFVPGVMKTEVLPPKVEGSSCQVRYEINVVKKFHYVLNMFEESPHTISWTLADSNIMKSNSGRWSFKEEDSGSVHADYQVEATFRGLVPKKLTDQVAKASIPGLIQGIQKLIHAKADQ